MKVFCVWLVMVAVSLTAFSSCVNPAQELSAYWNGHDFGSLDGFDDIDAAEEKFDGYIDLLINDPTGFSAMGFGSANEVLDAGFVIDEDSPEGIFDDNDGMDAGDYEE